MVRLAGICCLLREEAATKDQGVDFELTIQKGRYNSSNRDGEVFKYRQLLFTREEK